MIFQRTENFILINRTVHFKGDAFVLLSNLMKKQNKTKQNQYFVWLSVENESGLIIIYFTDMKYQFHVSLLST